MRRAVRNWSFGAYRYTKPRKNSNRQYIRTLGNLLREGMEKIINKEALPQAVKCCKIVPAALGEQIGDYAAIAAALL